MLNQSKQYPRAIIIRKNIIIIAALILSGIMGLIIHNLYRSSSLQSHRSTTHQKNIVIEPGEINWYKNQKIENFPQKNSESIATKKSIQLENNFHHNDQELYEKAMSAPINSNQITNSEQIDEKENKKQNEISQDHYLSSKVSVPISPYELKAGTIIPGILISGINSDLPGQIIGQVRSPVYDTISGQYLLVPQGTKLIGVYDAQIVYGQERLLVAWQRMIFPNGHSLDLQDMPGVDLSGYAGFNDRVDHHYTKVFGSVLLMSGLSAGAQLSQPAQTQTLLTPPSVNQMLAQSVGTQIANTSARLLNKNLNIQPTLKIQPGYLFNIHVTKDMVFPGPYA